MQILPVTSAMVPALAQLATDTFTETFGHLYPPEDLSSFLTASYAPAQLAFDVQDSAQFWRIVYVDHEAVGYLHAGPVRLPHPEADSAAHGELKRLYVRSSQQGKGLGKTLMRVALDHLSDTYGDAPQWVGVWSKNDKALSLYLAHGFAKVGNYQFPVGQTLDDEFILRRMPREARRGS